ncbi:hypothetical protein [Halobiforma nitratireducens]|uniref:Uncharacterized protein n=1 Tax=Halobiforma nitratireducens JCM 10879 TaxID=1227454 RepID=M0LZP3_9EURY|nr:hypothetical protein [Halobiforma nitratireducens]EMA37849.1 hypothetical protein C446_10500 [Halobiforma nitratireducens JCM 10879]
MSGGPKPRITTDDILEFYAENTDRCEPFDAPEIADHFACHRNTARNKLEDLVFLGELESKQIGSRKVYWRPCPERETTE